MGKLILQDLTFKILSICYEVHRHLGHGFLEAVYKDAIEVEAVMSDILIRREKRFSINYKAHILQHEYIADFIAEEKVILEIKAVENGITDYGLAQTINYLKVSGCKVGLIVNFGRKSLEHKRLIY